MSKRLNSVGSYYNKYIDSGIPPAYVDYRKQDNPYVNVKNNNKINYSKKNSPSYHTQITGQYLHSDVIGTDNKDYGNKWNVLIRPKPRFDAFGLRLLY